MHPLILHFSSCVSQRCLFDGPFVSQPWSSLHETWRASPNLLSALLSSWREWAAIQLSPQGTWDDSLWHWHSNQRLVSHGVQVEPQLSYGLHCGLHHLHSAQMGLSHCCIKNIVGMAMCFWQFSRLPFVLQHMACPCHPYIQSLPTPDIYQLCLCTWGHPERSITRLWGLGMPTWATSLRATALPSSSTLTLSSSAADESVCNHTV